MDPRAIRKVNYIKPAQLPYTNAVGQVYDSGAFAHMLERASKLADWDGFAARKKAAKKKGLLYGRGLTSYIEWTGGRAHTEKVSLHATAEGRIILHSGTQAMGQGLQTTYTQMVSESLGIPMDMDRMSCRATRISPPASAASARVRCSSAARRRWYPLTT